MPERFTPLFFLPYVPLTFPRLPAVHLEDSITDLISNNLGLCPESKNINMYYKNIFHKDNHLRLRSPVISVVDMTTLLKITKLQLT